MYSLIDAPLKWCLGHRDPILSLLVAAQSRLCCELFLLRDDKGPLIGMVSGPSCWRHGHLKRQVNRQIAKLRKMRCYGKQHACEKGAHHRGHYAWLVGNGQGRMATCA